MSHPSTIFISLAFSQCEGISSGLATRASLGIRQSCDFSSTETLTNQRVCKAKSALLHSPVFHHGLSHTDLLRHPADRQPVTTHAHTSTTDRPARRPGEAGLGAAPAPHTSPLNKRSFTDINTQLGAATAPRLPHISPQSNCRSRLPATLPHAEHHTVIITR